MALTPGGLVIMAVLPFVGYLLSKYDARRLIVLGLAALSLALFYMMNSFNLQMSFHLAVMARIYQAAGLAFLFVPINTISYAYLPREKNNAVSGLMNLARNIGGSVGISVVTTMLDRRAQFHQSRLAGNFSAASVEFQQRLRGITGALQARGFSAADASHKAYALLQGSLWRQSNMLAYIDNFYLLGVVSLAMIPLVFLMKRPPAGRSMAAH
jgi:DHA2 family multidrug resistance protein